MKKPTKKSRLSTLFLSIAAGAVIFASPIMADAAATSFKDEPRSLDHHESIINLSERGIIQGYEDGTFQPDATLTRAMLPKFLCVSSNWIRQPLKTQASKM